MILELVRRLSEVDDSLSLSMNVSSDGVYSFAVDGMDMFGEIYCFSSTDVSECYSKISNFIDCLNDSEKFFSLVKEIESKSLEG